MYPNGVRACYIELPCGQVGITIAICTVDEASIQSPSLWSAWCTKARLSYSVIVGSEGKRNGVPRRGSYVGRIEFEAVADNDLMGHRGYC